MFFVNHMVFKDHSRSVGNVRIIGKRYIVGDCRCFMFGSIPLRCIVNHSTQYSCICTNMSSTHVHHTVSRMLPILRLAKIGDIEEPMVSPCFC